MRPLIFLDFDDVLCLNASDYNSMMMLRVIDGVTPDTPDTPELWEHLMDRKSVDNLRQLDAEFKPLYVISSSWATHLTNAQLCDVLTRTQLGFVGDNLHEEWKTPRARSSSRRDEIEWWLDANRKAGQAFIVIDDTDSGYTLAYTYFAHEGHLVMCSAGGRSGFGNGQLETARKHLRRQLIQAE